MKIAGFVLACIVLAAGLAVAQDHPAMSVQANTVYVGGDGKFEAAPDTAQLQFSVFAQEQTPQDAFQHASKNVEQVRQALRANGIDPKVATFGFLSVQPVYEYRPKQHIVAYRVTSDVLLKLKDFSKVGPITQQVADANVSENQTLSYTLENIDNAKDRAVEDAYRRARNSADVVAHASGRSLGELSYASVDTFENARPVMMSRMNAMAKMNNAAAVAAPNEEFTPQGVTVTAHVNALFNLK